MIRYELKIPAIVTYRQGYCRCATSVWYQGYFEGRRLRSLLQGYEGYLNHRGLAMNKLEPMTVVKHFKGNQYLVLGVAKHTELDSEFVVYRPLDGDRKLFVRPIDMFLSDVDKEKYPDVQQKERFEYVAPLKDILAAKATA